MQLFETFDLEKTTQNHFTIVKGLKQTYLANNTAGVFTVSYASFTESSSVSYPHQKVKMIQLISWLSCFSLAKSIKLFTRSLRNVLVIDSIS